MFTPFNLKLCHFCGIFNPSWPMMLRWLKFKLNLHGTECHSVGASWACSVPAFCNSWEQGQSPSIPQSPVHPSGQSLCPLGAGSAWLWSQEWVQVSFTPELGCIWGAWPEGELTPEISPRSHLFLLLSKQPKAWAVARATDVESSHLKIAYGVEINCFLISTSFK